MLFLVSCYVQLRSCMQLLSNLRKLCFCQVTAEGLWLAPSELDRSLQYNHTCECGRPLEHSNGGDIRKGGGTFFFFSIPCLSLRNFFCFLFCIAFRQFEHSDSAMDPPRGTRQAPFFSSQSLGGNIDFRFMRKPWAKIVTEELAADAIRTPGCVETGCWLHVDMAEGGDAEEYQQELMVSFAPFQLVTSIPNLTYTEGRDGTQRSRRPTLSIPTRRELGTIKTNAPALLSRLLTSTVINFTATVVMKNTPTYSPLPLWLCKRASSRQLLGR